MSNQVWNDNNNDINDQSTVSDAHIRSINLTQSKIINGAINKNATSKTNVPNEVTSASSGYSEGVKRSLELVATASSEKRKCLFLHNSTTKLNSVLNLAAEIPPQSKSVSSISGLTPNSDNLSSPSIIECSENFKKMTKSIELEDKQNQKRIESYVKDHLFKHLKIIPSQEMMFFSTNENSLNYFVCKALNIRVQDQYSYWSKYSKFVERAINAARNNAVSALKRSFLKGNTRVLQLTLQFPLIAFLFILDYLKFCKENE